jgi:hypothetical protein
MGETNEHSEVISHGRVALDQQYQNTRTTMTAVQTNPQNPIDQVNQYAT